MASLNAIEKSYLVVPIFFSNSMQHVLVYMVPSVGKYFGTQDFLTSDFKAALLYEKLTFMVGGLAKDIRDTSSKKELLACPVKLHYLIVKT